MRTLYVGGRVFTADPEISWVESLVTDSHSDHRSHRLPAHARQRGRRLCLRQLTRRDWTTARYLIDPWAVAHPGTVLIPININDAVELMVHRTLLR